MKQKKTREIYIEINTLRVTKTRPPTKKTSAEQRFEEPPKEPEKDSFFEKLFWTLSKMN